MHAASIRDSANKLREKMRVRAFQNHQVFDKLDSLQINKQTVQYALSDRTSVRPQINQTARNMVYETSPKVEKETNLIKSVVSNDEPQLEQQHIVNVREYDSKLTFSGEKCKTNEIRILEDKLQQTENIVLDLQK